MVSLRNIIIFVAGIEFWHTFTHIFLALFVSLPLDTKIIVITPTTNMWGILVNGAITILLLWWSSRLSK